MAVLVVAIAAKVIPCALAAKKMGRRKALVVGVAMVPRAEVGIIVAALGLRSGILDDDLYGVVVMMSVLTTLVTPPVLRLLLRPSAEEVVTRT